MRILFIDAYFRPELTSFTHLEDDIIQGLLLKGCEIEVICPTPTRNVGESEEISLPTEYEGKLTVKRFSAPKERKNPISRAMRYFWCGMQQKSLGKKTKGVDVVFSNSTPPTQGLTCAKIAKKLSKKYKRKVPFVYNLQDVFPDSLVNAGLAKKGSLIWKIGRKIENKTYAAADKIIVISESFKQNIIEKGVPEEKIEVVYNWVDTEKVKRIDKSENRLYDELSLKRDAFTVVYAGNFGVSQGVETIIKAAKLLKGEKDVLFVLFGGGTEYERIKSLAESENLSNVTVTSLLSEDRVSEVYSLGDVSLITCKTGAGMSAMPSKTWSIMACESPIIASFDKGSELESILDKAHAGVCVEPEDPEALAKKIKEFYALKKDGSPYASNGRAFVEQNSSTKTCVKKYVETIVQSKN